MPLINLTFGFNYTWDEDDLVDYNGSSIISKLDEITNSKVRAISINEPGKNGHTNVYISDEAVDYINEINILYKELYDSYEGKIPYEVNQEFYSGIDRSLAHDLDPELMNEINTFFLECLN